METSKVMAKRYSCRNFKPIPISDSDIETLLKAGIMAPVGHGEYHALHLTVVQNPIVLDALRDTAVDCFSDPILDIYYGAQTVIVISSSHGSVPELDMCNAGAIAQNIMLTAADMGIDSCYIWGTVLAVRAEPDLLEDLQLPEGVDPIASVALGYATYPAPQEKTPALDKIAINWVK